MAIAIRELHTLAEMHQAEAIQREIWHMPDTLEVVPLHVLVTAQKNGGLLLGAFDGEQMVGLLFGFLGRAPDGHFKHCSHMLGMLDDYRGQGIGLMLKHQQRAFVQSQGLDLITWTYDPLECANATLNIHKLGATCRTYLRNVYGNLDDDLNRGLPTDRFEVEWWINTERIERRVTQTDQNTLSPTLPDLPHALDINWNTAGFPVPGDWRLLDAPRVLIEIPARFQQTKAHDQTLGGTWRMITRSTFEQYFTAGYSVVDVHRSAEGDRMRCWYELER